jgi:hypothetical protein
MRRSNGGGGGGGIPPGAVVGDYVAGGVYAGIITYDDAREFHLILSLQDATLYGAPWGANGLIVTSRDRYDGLQNQTDALSSGESVPAVEHCAAYTDADGNNDYYMPSELEIEHLYTNLAGHAELSDINATGVYTYTSKESTNASYVYAMRFADGYGHDLQGPKTATNRYTRPIRRIAA